MAQALTSVSKSKLRDPAIIEFAQHGAVEIQMGSDEENLVLSPKSEWVARQSLNELARVLITGMTSQRLSEPVPAALLGDVGFIASWSGEEKARFFDRFMDVLSESLRTGDPALTYQYLSLMASPDVDNPSPTLTGKLDDVGEGVVRTRAGRRPR